MNKDIKILLKIPVAIIYLLLKLISIIVNPLNKWLWNILDDGVDNKSKENNDNKTKKSTKETKS